jgi:HK97 family phage prohead protease
VILTFADQPAPTAAGRVIAGMAVPWDTPGRPVGYDGTVIFRAGSIDPATMGTGRLLIDHDAKRPVGRAIAAVADKRGAHASWRVASTHDGNEALQLVAEGVRDGLSVGATVHDYEVTSAGELIVLRATLRETSLLTFPAYDAARAALTKGTK